MPRVVLTNIKVALLTFTEYGRRVPQYVIASRMSDVLGYPLHPYTLSQYATGQIEMPLARRIALAKVLGVEVEGLFGSSEFEIE